MKPFQQFRGFITEAAYQVPTSIIWCVGFLFKLVKVPFDLGQEAAYLDTVTFKKRVKAMKKGEL